MIEIELNGETKSMPQPLTIEQALAHWGYSSSEIAVALNGEFVPRSRYNECQINAQDTIEIVAPIQGG